MPPGPLIRGALSGSGSQVGFRWREGEEGSQPVAFLLWRSASGVLVLLNACLCMWHEYSSWLGDRRAPGRCLETLREMIDTLRALPWPPLLPLAVTMARTVRCLLLEVPIQETPCQHIRRVVLVEVAVNYSPQAADLLPAGTITFDRWKCSPWPELISGARGTRLLLYLHFDLQAGSGTGGEVALDDIAALVADTATPYINLHLAPRRADYPGIPVGSGEPAHLEEILERTRLDLVPVSDRFGSERVIIENLPYRGPEGARLRMGAEAVFMHRVCEEVGCGFLLDIAHARTAAYHLGLDEREYLSSLPVHRLCELHVSGVDRDENGHLREHMPLSQDDWDLLGWCLEEICRGRWACPWVVSLEYGGIGPLMEWRSRASVLAEQVPRLVSLVRPAEDAAEGAAGC